MTTNFPTLTYQVKWTLIKFSFTDKQRDILIDLCKEYNINFLQLIADYANGEEVKGSYLLHEIVKEFSPHSKDFINEQPIEARREAVNFAKNINDVICGEDSQYYDAGSFAETIEQHGLKTVLESEQLRHGFNLCAVSVWADYKKQWPLCIGSSYPVSIETVKALQNEYIIYEYNGFSIGKETPFEWYYPIENKTIKLLPDVEKQLINKAA